MQAAFLCSSNQDFFAGRFVRDQVVQIYRSTNMATDGKNSCFILSEISYFYMINRQSIAVYAWKIWEFAFLK